MTSQPTPTPVCSYYLVKLGTPDPFLDYDGSKLKRCSRCKGSFYINQATQKKHWKAHKKYCKLVDDTTQRRIQNKSLDECLTDLNNFLRNEPSVVPETYYVMKRLRVLFDEDVDDVSDAAFRLHSQARGLIMYPLMNLMQAVIACPHMATLLFGDEEDLLSKKNRIIKHKFAKYNGRPSEEFIEDIEDEEEKRVLKESVEEYDELDTWGSQPSSMSYCYFYYNLIVACAVRGNRSHSSVHDGVGTLRGDDPCNKSPESLLAVAALRRAMELWTDPLVLASCGDAMAPAASLALTALDYYVQHEMFAAPPLCRKHEVAPGMAIDRVAMTCMSELLESAGSASYSIKLLRSLGGMAKMDWEGDEEPWTDMPVERRARFALATIRYFDEGDTESHFGVEREIPWGSINDLFKSICGMQNPRNVGIVKSTLKKAAEDGEFLGPHGAGFNANYRAFFYYACRGDLHNDTLDFAKVFKEYDEIPNIHRAPEDAKAKEKDECLRLAYGDKRHRERMEIFK